MHQLYIQTTSTRQILQNINTNNIISFAAQHAVVDVHYHQCFQAVISMGTPFNSIIGGRPYSNLRGFLINQAITHSCMAQDTSVLVYFIDSDSYRGWQLKEMLAETPFVPIDEVLTAVELAGFTTQYQEAQSAGEIRKMAAALLDKILPSTAGAGYQPADGRVLKVIEYIDANLDNPLALEDVSKHIFLSPERVRHLFVQQTGIPFSQYVLWKRIKLVLTEVIKLNVPMVTSAIQNGFTDQAHFARLFRRTFGVSATNLLKNSRFVQFLTPEL